MGIMGTLGTTSICQLVVFCVNHPRKFNLKVNVALFPSGTFAHISSPHTLCTYISFPKMSMFDRISEPVEVEDIIMVFPSRIEVQAADIWIVRSCPDGNPPCPRTDSIMVSAGLYARSTTRGRWCLFGPDVDYIPDEFENEEDIENRELFSLKDVLDPLARIRGQYDNIRITVNPHGK